MGLVDISYSQLMISLMFVLVAGAASVRLELGLERDILWGTVRTFSQLFIVGFLLTYVFALNSAILVLLIFTGMIVFSAYIIRGRVKETGVPYFVPTFISMFASYMLVTLVVTAFVIQADPWYKPQYFIPLGGMIIGNSMSAIAISLRTIFADIRRQRMEIELYLILGASHREATHRITREAIRAGMIPTLNSMMAVGVVFLPGMMTGQILAGADPLTSIKYQIVVMLMLVGSTALGCIIVSFIGRDLCFNQDQQLILGEKSEPAETKPA
jgi:putative ABC transport system permease protein